MFMTVLIHELKHRTGERLNAAIVGADDHTRQRFTTDYERPLYREGDLLGPTRAAGAHKKTPLVFRFTNQIDRPRGPDGNQARAVLWPAARRSTRCCHSSTRQARI